VKIAAQVGDRIHEVDVEAVDGRYHVTIDGSTRRIDAVEIGGGYYTILNEGGRSYDVSVEARRDGYLVRHRAAEMRVTLTDPGRTARRAAASGGGPEEVRAQMPGKVVRVLVSVGDVVEAGQGLVVVEAMKMENEVAAPRQGRVTAVAVEAGHAVAGGAVLVVLG
jgi:biotin carboxyl carrier protein